MLTEPMFEFSRSARRQVEFDTQTVDKALNAKLVEQSEAPSHSKTMLEFTNRVHGRLLVSVKGGDCSKQSNYCFFNNMSKQYGFRTDRKNMAIRANTGKYSKIQEFDRKKGIRGCQDAHIVDDPFRTTVQKPWKNDSSVNTNKQWLYLVSKRCERISSIHIIACATHRSGRPPLLSCTIARAKCASSKCLDAGTNSARAKSAKIKDVSQKTCFFVENPYFRKLAKNHVFPLHPLKLKDFRFEGNAKNRDTKMTRVHFAFILNHKGCTRVDSAIFCIRVSKGDD